MAATRAFLLRYGIDGDGGTDLVMEMLGHSPRGPSLAKRFVEQRRRRAGVNALVERTGKTVEELRNEWHRMQLAAILLRGSR